MIAGSNISIFKHVPLKKNLKVKVCPVAFFGLFLDYSGLKGKNKFKDREEEMIWKELDFGLLRGCLCCHNSN